MKKCWDKSLHGTCVPIKLWLNESEIDEEMLAQILDVARHPAVYRHMAVMADGHLGYGMPIGGVIACDRAIIPYAVGSDIGCGMAAVKTSVTFEEGQCFKDEVFKRMMGDVRKAIPMGMGIEREEDQEWTGFNEKWLPLSTKVRAMISKARKQLGTLGAGNHFIEFQEGDDGHLWLMLHSGSRKLGYEVAKHYHEKAVEMCGLWHADIPNKELAFFPLPSEMGTEYFKAMNYALEYAQENRRLMMVRVQEAVASEFGDVEFTERINIHHNYAAWENHFGKNVIVHRKGATSAKKGQMGIIPGSMGTPSYIVKGLGNPESFESCSHGAGRIMGRNQANRTLTIEECNKAMGGVIFGRWSTDRKGRVDLSEAPQAYKDIEQVIAAQDDLVEVVVKLRPLAAMKG